MISKTNGVTNVGNTQIKTSTNVYSGTNIQSIRLNSSSSIPATNYSSQFTSHLSFTTSPFAGITNKKSVSLDPTSFSISNIQDFNKQIKSKPLDVQLQTLATSISSIGTSISDLQSYFTLNDFTNISKTISQIQNQVKIILPYATDEQINSKELQLQQQQSMNLEYGSFRRTNPNDINIPTSFETSMIHTGGTIDWGMVVESGGSLYAAGKKFEQYSSLLENPEGLSSFGEELLGNAETYGTLVGETIGVDMSEGALASFGIEGLLGTAGVGALEVGTLAAGGLVGIAALAILGASYGLYKAFGGTEDLGGLWNDTAKFFSNLFSP